MFWYFFITTNLMYRQTSTSLEIGIRLYCMPQKFNICKSHPKWSLLWFEIRFQHFKQHQKYVLFKIWQWNQTLIKERWQISIKIGQVLIKLVLLKENPIIFFHFWVKYFYNVNLKFEKIFKILQKWSNFIKNGQSLSEKLIK